MTRIVPIGSVTTPRTSTSSGGLDVDDGVDPTASQVWVATHVTTTPGTIGSEARDGRLVPMWFVAVTTHV